MSVSRTLVTGASGFIGRPLVKQLVRRGDEVHALSRQDPGEDDRGVRWHRLDIADTVAVDALIGELAPARIVHLAWYVEHGRFWGAPENLDWVQHSLRLLRSFAAAGGGRMVMIGTCAEYDWSAAGAPLRELVSPLAPATLYGTAKDALRRVAEAYAEQAGIELAWARPFFFYGPRENPARLVASVISSLLAGAPVETTEGTQRRDFMHVEDVAGAIAALLDSAVRGPVNVAYGQAPAVSELVARIAAIIGREDLLRVGALPDRDEPPLLVGDVHRLRDEVGYVPRLSLDEGLRETVRWWQAQSTRR
jgi:nucleoside-diphosphate-sugar epimerase